MLGMSEVGRSRQPGYGGDWWAAKPTGAAVSCCVSTVICIGRCHSAADGIAVSTGCNCGGWLLCKCMCWRASASAVRCCVHQHQTMHGGSLIRAHTERHAGFWETDYGLSKGDALHWFVWSTWCDCIGSCMWQQGEWNMASRCCVVGQTENKKERPSYLASLWEQ